MAISSRIPLPDPNHVNDVFSDVFNYFENVKNRKMKQPLIEAQTQEAQANAAKSKMLANLINMAMGGQSIGAANQGAALGENETENKVQPTARANLTPNMAMLASGLLGLPTQVVEGQLVTPFGVQKIGESPSEKRLAEAQKGATQKTLESTSGSALGSLGVNASFKSLDELMKQPNYSRIAGTLEGKAINSQFLGMPTGAILQKTFSKTFTPEDARLAGQVEAHFGNIVTGVAQKFKGPFKDMVRGIINAMKPNMGDSLAVQQGKISTLKQLSDLADRQNEAIDLYINAGMSPTAAILKVAKEIPLQPILNQLSVGSQQVPNSKMVKVRDNETGKVVEMSMDEYQKLVGGGQ